MAGKVWLSQPISNHPKFSNITRKVNVRNASLQAQYEQITIDAHITYFDENGEDVSRMFATEVPNWIINNQQRTTVRNMQGVPQPNPNYDENDPNSEEYLRLPSFDYFYKVITQSGASLIQLLAMHIQLNDAERFFNF